MREINLAKFAAARQSALPLGKHSVTLQRPTPWDVSAAQGAGQRLDIEWAAQFVVGWDFTEADLLPGGDPEPVAFNADVFATWVKDHPATWQPLIEGVIAAYKAHEASLDERGNV